MRHLLRLSALWASGLCMANADLKKTQTVLFLGDSITAGYGLNADEAYPQILQSRLKDIGKTYEFVNAAESGSLSASLKSRLESHLKRRNVFLVVIASGGNDARQGTQDFTRAGSSGRGCRQTPIQSS